MKKLFLVLMVLAFTFILASCTDNEAPRAQIDAEGVPTFTLSDVEDLIEEAKQEIRDEYDWQIEYQDDYIWYLEDVLEIQMEFILWLNDESIMRDRITGEIENLESQYEELNNAYALYLIENYPDYFDAEWLEDDPPEVFIYTSEAYSIEVEYRVVNLIIIIDEIEMCGDICEVVEFTQTDFVLTVEELEAYWKIWLDQWVITNGT